MAPHLSPNRVLLALTFVSLLVAGRAAADEPPPPPAAPPEAVQPPPPPAPVEAAPAPVPTAAVAATPGAVQPFPRWLIHVNIAFNVYTYLGATDTLKETHLTPAERTMVFQILGFGYFVHPKLRLGLQVQFGESVFGGGALYQPSPSDKVWTLLAFIPWAVFHHKTFFIGAGPMIAPRAYGEWNPSGKGAEIGIFTAFGNGWKLSKHVGINLAVQIPITLFIRPTVAVTPALVLGFRF